MKRVLILALATMLMGPSLLAHEGHAHKVLGTVTAVQKNQVEVKDKDGKLSKHVVDAKTKIRRGKSNASLTEIKVGDRVVVTFVQSKDKAGKEMVTVTQVDLGVTPTATQK